MQNKTESTYSTIESVSSNNISFNNVISLHNYNSSNKNLVNCLNLRPNMCAYVNWEFIESFIMPDYSNISLDENTTNLDGNSSQINLNTKVVSVT